MAFTIRPFPAPAGAEVLGLSVDTIDSSALSEVRRAFLAYGFLVFRDQNLSPATHETFSAQFGPLKGHVLKQYLLPGSDFVLVLSNKKVDGVPVMECGYGIFNGQYALRVQKMISAADTMKEGGYE